VALNTINLNINLFPFLDIFFFQRLKWPFS
jgi:hypothetical protein